MHNYTKMNPTLTQTTILNTFIKSDILIQPLTPPKTYKKIQKSKIKCYLSHPHTMYYI